MLNISFLNNFALRLHNEIVTKLWVGCIKHCKSKKCSQIVSYLLDFWLFVTNDIKNERKIKTYPSCAIKFRFDLKLINKKTLNKGNACQSTVLILSSI